MVSEKAVCSKETAHALEILHGKQYAGKSFNIGDIIEICGVKVKTFPTFHTIGSCAFYWENETGTRILVTGDVKDAKNLPECDVLVTEANYGDPDDSKCYFRDDIDAFNEVVSTASYQNIVFGAYAFGKAQRAVKMLRESGYLGDIGMEALSLTKGLMKNIGNLVALNKDCDIRIVTPAQLSYLSIAKKFILTGRHNNSFPTITLSDHMDVEGLISMVLRCNPQAVIVYHPRGYRPLKLASYLNKIGIYSLALQQIDTVLQI